MGDDDNITTSVLQRLQRYITDLEEERDAWRAAHLAGQRRISQLEDALHRATPKPVTNAECGTQQNEAANTYTVETHEVEQSREEMLKVLRAAKAQLNNYAVAIGRHGHELGAPDLRSPALYSAIAGLSSLIERLLPE